MKTRAISDYIQTYPNLHDWLYLNVVSEAPGNMALLTDSDDVIESFIGGVVEKRYLFDIAMLAHYDDGTSDININALEEAEQLIEWVKRNNSNKIFPDFGENCNIESITVLSDVPQVAVSENNIARYMLNLQIDYIERT